MARNNRFLRYFRPLLDALRSVDPRPMRPAEAIAYLRGSIDIPHDDLTRRISNGRQKIFENDIHWASSYLVTAGLISKAKRGQWELTDTGRRAFPSPEEVEKIYKETLDQKRAAQRQVDENDIAPDLDEDYGEAQVFWLVGADWNKGEDQTDRFLRDKIWENGHENTYLDDVRRMRPGDRIVIKSSFVQKHKLPFDVGGQRVSVMRIKATGTIVENMMDGRRVRVVWDSSTTPRDWYFYTYRQTVERLTTADERAAKLYDFAFNDAPQDYDWWLNSPYFAKKYGNIAPQSAAIKAVTDHTEDKQPEPDHLTDYDVSDIIAEGCFLPEVTLTTMLARWTQRKNLILQGPPGTGKTWLARKLGYALIGSNNREITRTRLRIVQFHPSLSYEDFVRGYRPITDGAGEGRLALRDGVMMEAIEAAVSEPGLPFVLVIEEINRGNPAQIFGEMLTLLEHTKRDAAEAIELTYRRHAQERVHIPSNLYVIGTMNVADRSLAMVDLALRRRFAFFDLEPAFGTAWRDWCGARGIASALLDEIAARINSLNAIIAAAPALGPQFRIGHSFLTPDETIVHAAAWYRAVVETEIGPLLDEHWYDTPEMARQEKEKLLSGLTA